MNASTTTVATERRNASIWDALIPSYRQDSPCLVRAVSLLWEGIKREPTLPGHLPDVGRWHGRAEWLGNALLWPKDFLLSYAPNFVTATGIILGLTLTGNLEISQEVLDRVSDLFGITPAQLLLSSKVVAIDIVAGHALRFFGRLTGDYLTQLSPHNTANLHSQQ